MPEKNDPRKPQFGELRRVPDEQPKVIEQKVESIEELTDIEWRRWLEWQQQRHAQRIQWVVGAPFIAAFVAGAAWLLRWGLGLL